MKVVLILLGAADARRWWCQCYEVRRWWRWLTWEKVEMGGDKRVDRWGVADDAWRDEPHGDGGDIGGFCIMSTLEFSKVPSLLDLSIHNAYYIHLRVFTLMSNVANIDMLKKLLKLKKESPPRIAPRTITVVPCKTFK